MQIPVLCTPAFHKAHTDSTHSSQLVDGFKALVHRLSEQDSELLIIEDLEITAWPQQQVSAHSCCVIVKHSSANTMN